LSESLRRNQKFSNARISAGTFGVPSPVTSS
jgi:hypothetical protein